MSAGVIRAAEPPITDVSQIPKVGKPSVINADLLRGVRVTLEAQLGKAEMTVDELMALKPGSIVPLESGLADHLDLYLNGTLVARGAVVAVDDKFAIRIVEVGPA